MGMRDAVQAARSVMGGVIGPEELARIGYVRFADWDATPEIPFTFEELKAKGPDYLLVLGMSALADGTPVTLNGLCGRYGKDPALGEPCFYNQDWYEHEPFADNPLDDGWYLIRREVYEDSRSEPPDKLNRTHSFPSAIRCAYAFFAAWEALGVSLWERDFVWCNDRDHNGDRIYVGRYHDPDGVNKDGFNVHRHLALRPCYGCID